MVLALALASLLAVGCTQVQAQGLDQRIPVKPGGLLQVDLDLGEEVRPDRVSLEVRTHDADEVWAVADLSGLGASSVKFRVDHDERVVRLYGRAGGLISWIFGGPGVAVRVWVPREFSVDLRCASGPIRIEDVNGSIRARTSDASVEVRGAEGDLDLRTRSGAVHLTEVVGDVDIRASEGSIELSWVTGNIDARTGRGQVHASHLKGRIALEGVLESRQGSIEVVFPEHAGLELEARTRRGAVELGAGVKVDGRREADHFVGSVNGGGPRLAIYTARGNVRVDRR
jgi:hypothetical protein